MSNLVALLSTKHVSEMRESGLNPKNPNDIQRYLQNRNISVNQLMQENIDRTLSGMPNTKPKNYRPESDWDANKMVGRTVSEKDDFSYNRDTAKDPRTSIREGAYKQTPTFSQQRNESQQRQSRFSQNYQGPNEIDQAADNLALEFFKAFKEAVDNGNYNKWAVSFNKMKDMLVYARDNAQNQKVIDTINSVANEFLNTIR